MIYYFQGYCVSLKQALEVTPFFKGKLIRNLVAAIDSMNDPFSIINFSVISISSFSPATSTNVGISPQNV